MKRKLHQFILTSILVSVSLGSYAATSSYTIDDNTTKAKLANMTEAQKEARIEEIKTRIEEIKAMDKSELSKADRKDLRKELRDMQKEAKEGKGGGVYIGLAGILIIILVLILIL